MSSKNRVSPLNTVFQKLVVPQSLTQTSQMPSEPDFKDSSQFAVDGSVALRQLSMSKPTSKLLSHNVIVKQQVSGKSDKLLISVKPLRENEGSSSSHKPDGDTGRKRGRSVVSEEQISRNVAASNF